MSSQGRAPRIWRVLGDKRGDNGQVEVIAEALARQRGWTSELRHLEMQPRYVFGKPRVGPTLYHLDPERSDALTPPWPDLILTSGRRPANAALWIKQQSGGRSRIVLVGKPSGWMAHFDLIITSAETLPAPFPNVMHIGLPLMQLDPARLEAGRAEWEQAFAALPRPLVAFLIGGPTNPFVYNNTVVRRLRDRIDQVLASGGTPYLVGSRRTPPRFMQRLRRDLPAAVQVYDWNDPQDGNPYAGLLALGDRFVVTGDSISMQVEVARLGRPLEILPLPTGWFGGIDNARRRLAAWLFQPVRADNSGEQARIATARALYHLRLLQQTRHFPRFHQMLVDQGLARWAGDDADAAGAHGGPDRAGEQTEQDLQRILERIDRLLPDR
ncbi:nucleoside-diphosphate-sugar epimerase [Thiohalobacter thiocyanaticus]|uniref:Nucleoside-diphosphate-sugar epimerase n=1 Tax=Thiohalobacter thiocyanaticus TaxID=585455 RepID=A0A1Z4VPX0_9GAMM|nr:ELM1/GtrOC1 family putative glycosyltransferase [Thiohalobacter thiocyanaticus]BAZ93686.1 nucleoside-diphosphate-sugar epimerase [Thiohalobacter thiocyanaticus]